MNAATLPIASDAELSALHKLVEANPGLTSAQMAELFAMDREPLLDRLYALQRAGLAHAAELTTCRHTGRPASVWRPGRDPLLRTRTEEYYSERAGVVPPIDPTFAADAA